MSKLVSPSLLYDAIYAPCRTSYVTAGGLRILENKNKREKEAKKAENRPRSLRFHYELCLRYPFIFSLGVEALSY